MANERQTLIGHLLDDVMPEIRTTRDPEQSLLKFARQQNLPIAQLEMMGHLFNTARTLNYLNKAATVGKARGDSFPLLDVPQMLGRYLDPEPATKSAMRVELVTAGEQPEVAEDLPVCLAAWRGQEFAPSVRVQPASNPWEVPIFKVASVIPAAGRKELEFFAEAQANAEYDFQQVVMKVAQVLREHPEADFEKASAEALSLHGASMEPVSLVVAHHLAMDDHWLVKVAAAPAEGLVEDAFGLTTMLGQAHASHCLFRAATELLHEQVEPKEAGAAKPPPGAAPSASSASSTTPDWMSGLTGGVSGLASGLKKVVPGSGPGAVAGSVFGSAMADPANEGFRDRVKQEQRYEQKYRTTQQTALMQKLLMTDDVLSEADPHRVMEIYDTVRQYFTGALHRPQCDARTLADRGAARGHGSKHGEAIGGYFPGDASDRVGKRQGGAAGQTAGNLSVGQCLWGRLQAR